MNNKRMPTKQSRDIRQIQGAPQHVMFNTQWKIPQCFSLRFPSKASTRSAIQCACDGIKFTPRAPTDVIAFLDVFDVKDRSYSHSSHVAPALRIEEIDRQIRIDSKLHKPGHLCA